MQTFIDRADTVTRACIIPRFARGDDDFSTIKNERMKQRLEEINTIIKSQNFYEWLATQNEKGSKSRLGADSLWYLFSPLHFTSKITLNSAICLDDFTEDAQIRGLRCSHAFHAHCLDEWFARFNEYCPLCHRTIIPGRKVTKNNVYQTPATITATFIV